MPVVIAKEHKVLPPGHANGLRPVFPAPDPGVLKMESESGIVDAPDHVVAARRGGVVGDNDLEIRMRLGQGGTDGPGQHLGAPVRSDGDADESLIDPRVKPND